MKKKSVGAIVVRTLLKAFGIMFLLIGVGVGSYFLTMLYYNMTEREERSTQYEHVIAVNPSSESSNLIYSVDSDRLIKAVVLELFDKETGKIDYVTIPNKTQIALSNESYEYYKEISPNMPQIVTLRDINQYFEGDVAYEYGILLLQEELDVNIGYFTAMDAPQFNRRFEKTENEAFAPTDAYLDAVSAYKDEQSMKDFIESEWDSVISDITLEQKMQYANSFLKVNREDIGAYRAYAEEIRGQASLKVKKTKRLIDKIWDGEAKKQTTKKNSQTQTAAVVDISNCSIQITNGSQITGLAAVYKTKLEADGHKVLGVGNYSGEIQSKTIIFAKKKKWARALRSYFKAPTIQQADDLTNGADIEIVLGTEDDVPR